MRDSAPAAGAGPWVTAHVPGASCWDRAGASICIFPKIGMHWGVRLQFLVQLQSQTSQQVGGPGSRRGYQLGGWSMLGFGRPTSVKCLWDEYIYECVCLPGSKEQQAGLGG